MPYWNWDPSLEIGIRVIDEQHRRIVDYINELHAEVTARRTERVGQILGQVVEYTKTHFAFEESLMQQAGYRQLEEHKRVHETYTQRMRSYQERFDKGEDISRALMNDLKIWLTNHIQRDDRDYAPYLHDLAKGSWVRATLRRFFG